MNTVNVRRGRREGHGHVQSTLCSTWYFSKLSGFTRTHEDRSLSFAVDADVPSGTNAWLRPDVSQESRRENGRLNETSRIKRERNMYEQVQKQRHERVRASEWIHEKEMARIGVSTNEINVYIRVEEEPTREQTLERCERQVKTVNGRIETTVLDSAVPPVTSVFASVGRRKRKARA